MARDASKAYQSAYQMYAKGEHRGARSLLEAALRDKPGDAPAMFLLGVLDLEEGAMEAGARRLEEAAGTIEPKAQLAHRAGRLFFDHKDLPRAEKWLTKACELNPGEAASHFWLGNVLRLKGEFQAARGELMTAIDLAPSQARGYVALAYLYREEGDFKKAAETMMTLHARGPKTPEAQEKIAGFLMEIERPDLAEKVLTRLLPERNEDSAFLISLGRIRQKLGMFHEAGQVYRRAIIRDANADAAYLGLSVIKKFEDENDPDAVILKNGLEAPGLSDSARMCCHFALGKVMDDLGDYREAFRHFKTANDLKAGAAPFDTKAYLKESEAIRGTFTKTYFSALDGRMPYSKTPVFMVGMLRSGTTLLEHMLAQHKDVFAAGELPFIPTLARELRSEAGLKEPFPGYLSEISNELLSGAGAYYLKTVAGLSSGESFFVDKNPMNFRYLGLVATLFPGAKVIHCKRHPLDTALSLYFQNFAHDDAAFAYKLSDIEAVYKAYRALMEHWYEVLPLDIFDLDYESLVKFPERVMRRLIAWLGLPWDDQVLEAGDLDRAVSTASLWQVRQPIYRSSIERWKHYEAELTELKKAFVKANIM